MEVAIILKIILVEDHKGNSNLDLFVNSKLVEIFKVFRVIWLISKIKELELRHRECHYQRIRYFLKAGFKVIPIILAIIYLQEAKNSSNSNPKGKLSLVEISRVAQAMEQIIMLKA
jgi:hypothetical protein